MKNEKTMKDDELENVSGGYIFNQSRIPGGGDNIWELIDDKTDRVLYRSKDKNVILDMCKGPGYSVQELRYDQLVYLRKEGWIPK